jgi:hypothetical protein
MTPFTKVDYLGYDASAIRLQRISLGAFPVMAGPVCVAGERVRSAR